MNTELELLVKSIEPSLIDFYLYSENEAFAWFGRVLNHHQLHELSALGLVVETLPGGLRGRYRFSPVKDLDTSEMSK